MGNFDYKNRLYDNYVSTHIVPRKGEATLDEFSTKTKAYHKHFGKFLPKDKNSKVLDCGCGNGSIVWWLQQNGLSNAEGIDISAEQVKVAQRLGVKNIKQGDLVDYLRAKKEVYNVIFLRDVIEHFGKKEIIQMLEFCYDSLAANGIMILQVPNAESPFGSRIRYGDFTHEVSFTSGSLSQVLRTIGFNKVEVYSVGPVVGGMRSFLRFVVWKLVELFYEFLLFIENGNGTYIVTQNIIAVGEKRVRVNFD